MIFSPFHVAAYRPLNFLRLLRTAPRPLAFGAIHTFASCPGQTYVVALFVPFVAGSFTISESTFAMIYAAVTVIGAFMLPYAGRLLDRVDLLAYAVATAMLVALGAITMAIAPNVAILFIGVLLLRFSGQGLMSHVALTGTARYFERDRGKALALVSLGYPISSATLPLVTLALIEVVGWRMTLGVGTAVVAAAAAATGILLVGALPGYRQPPVNERAQKDRPPRARSILLHPRFALTVPLLCATPFLLTALIFHQSALATRMAIPVEWFAASFVVFSAAEIAGNFVSGPAIDRFGAWTILPMHLLPFALGLAVIATFDAPWAVPIYLGGCGLSAGMSNTIRTAVVAEFVPLSEIGAARGQVTSLAVLTSALGPLAVGWMFDAGASVALVLWSSVGYIAVTTALAVAATRPQHTA